MKFSCQILLLISSASLLLTSCYAPLTGSNRGSYKDSTLTVYRYNMDGSLRSREDIKYKSRRKTHVDETVFVPLNVLAASDSGVVDTLTDTEIADKRFFIDDHIYIQRQKKQSYYGGSSTLIKEKTKKKSKFRDGCEIVVRKKTKIYNEYGDIVFKENFNFLYHRSVRKIYDEGGGQLESRKVKTYFKPKFRNYP